MTIYQQPDSLSLSGNIKDIILTDATDKVVFRLSVGSTLILEHIYYPDEEQRIVIDIRRFVEEQLSFSLTYSTVPWEQPLLARSFSFTAGNLAAQTFTAIRTGIDHPGETAANWLRSNFLTWQPTVKHVTYSTPELLTYYAASACKVRIKVYYPDGTSAMLTPITLTAGVWTIPVSYAVIASRLGLTSQEALQQAEQLPGAYDVWIEDTSANRLTYVQRYVAGNTRENEQWILFENSLGGVDCFRAYGQGSLETEHEHQLTDVDDETDEYRVDTVRRIRKSTGWMNMAERRWMLDFFPSRHRWICEDGVFRNIVLTEDSATYAMDNMPAEFEFTFRYTTNLAYLNVPRLLVPPSVLNITAPDLQSFSLPPRLAEFPRLDPSEGALIPVQSPYSDHWAAISVADLISGTSADISRLERMINAEASTRRDADQTISAALEQEIERATNIEEQIATALEQEIERATESERIIQASLDDMFTKDTSTIPARIRANYSLYTNGHLLGMAGVAAGGITDPSSSGGGGTTDHAELDNLDYANSGHTGFQPTIDASHKLAYSLISGTPTALPASDVYAWAKAATKPSYTFSEITGSASTSQIPELAISKISGLQGALDGKVPVTRTVNGHALSDNVTISKGDIGLGNVENKSSATIRSEITASDIPSLDASKITTGTFADARIASASAWNAKYDKPSTGIPLADLAAGVQASLGKADSAVQKTDVNLVTGSDSENNNFSLKLTVKDVTKTLVGIRLSGDTTVPAIIRNVVREATEDWSCGLGTIQVDGTGKFTIGAVGAYTLGATGNGLTYAYLGCNAYNGLNLRITASALTWGTDTIWHAGNSNRTTTDWSAKNLTLAGSISGATTIEASGRIHTAAQVVGDSGVAAGGITDPSSQGGGGGGSVNAISVNSTTYEPDASGVVTLPNYYNKTESDTKYATKTALQTTNIAVGALDTRLTADEANISGMSADITTLKGYFTEGSATNALKLGGKFASSYALKTDIPDVSGFLTQTVADGRYSQLGHTHSQYLTGINSAMIINALDYVPADLDYLTNNYLPLSGGTISGSISMNGGSNAVPFIRNFTFSSSSGWARDLASIQVDGVNKFVIGAHGSYTPGASNNGIIYAYIGCNAYNGLNLRINASSISWGDNTIYHSGNLTAATLGAMTQSDADARYLKLTGGSISGTLAVNSLLSANFGVDVSAVQGYSIGNKLFARYLPTNELLIGEGFKTYKTILYGSSVQIAGSNGLIISGSNGQQVGKLYAPDDTEIDLQFNNGSIVHTLSLYNDDDRAAIDGYTIIHSGNIGSQSVAYATSAGNADTVDGYHASAFAPTVHSHNVLIADTSTYSATADSAMPTGADQFKVFRVGTSSGAPGGDGHIMSFTWSSATAYGAQIYIDTAPTGNMSFRQRGSNGIWTSWNQIIHSSNYTSYCAPANHSHSYLPLSGGVMSGNIDLVRNTIIFREALSDASYGSGEADHYISFRTKGNYNHEKLAIGAMWNKDLTSVVEADLQYVFIGKSYGDSNNLRIYQGSVRVGTNIIYHSGNLTAATLGAMTQSAADERYWRPEVDRLASGKLTLSGGLAMLSSITTTGSGHDIGSSSDYFRFIHGGIFHAHNRIEVDGNIEVDGSIRKGGYYFRRYLGVYQQSALPGSSVAETGDYAIAQVNTNTFVFAIYATAGGRTGWWAAGQLSAI